MYPTLVSVIFDDSDVIPSHNLILPFQLSVMADFALYLSAFSFFAVVVCVPFFLALICLPVSGAG